MSLILRRREFLVGLVSAAFAAPSIVRTASIMPVRAPLLIPAPPVIAVEPKRAWVITGIEHTTDSYRANHQNRVRTKLRFSLMI